MKHTKIFCLLLAGVPLTVAAQHIRSGYVEKGVCGSDFPAALKEWEKGQKWTDDDNFFISRVKPRERFRNMATQVNPELDDSIDKKLIFWVPVNNETFNALPDGVFDSEVFPMWSYITHYGNWSTPLVRMPGGFADVAHKNGVPVSVVASVPYGRLSSTWKEALTQLTEVGAEKLADYLLYYGVDGIGYNSEFNTTATLVSSLCELHENTVRLMKENGRNPLTEFIWYDGTNKDGVITFDRGLDIHNKDLWGYGENIRTSLFLNYNWNFEQTLSKIVRNAKKYGRTSLDVYCGINMQGREPHNGNDEIWTLLEQYPVSIGLWGAHSENMFFESRAEQGSSPEQHQRTYLNRMLNWFANSSHNPAAYHPTVNSLIYSAANTEFFGMSKMMSARSALKWNLSDEPFITYFNLGNGRFFNYRGLRSHNAEWYNIAMQDYLPTWMWWFSSKFLGREATDIVTDGLKAEFVWDDAWMGGSTVRVYGSSSEEYLHLFKTEFPLEQGDEITFRYKLLNGSANACLAMSLKGNEEQPIAENTLQVMSNDATLVPGQWIEKKFIVGNDFSIVDGSEIAMIALHFSDADNLDIRLGEFSIKRPKALTPAVDAPVIESTQLLSARHDGVDGKIIFSMPNDKGDDVCYNTDVNTSLFKLYYQQEDCESILMGMTTSWAGLMFSAPYTGTAGSNVRFGVSALALDHITESYISWGEWQSTNDCYEISDDITFSKSILKPGESFTIGYADAAHETADWIITDSANRTVAEASDSKSITVAEGLATAGIYNLTIKGMEQDGDTRTETTRLLKGYIQITGEDTGDIPVITSLYASEAVPAEESGPTETPVTYISDTTEPELFYTVNPGIATMSRGVRIGNDGLGFRFKDTGMTPKKSFSVSFWFKPESFSHKAGHILNIRYKEDPWSVNHWGWFWHTLTEDGRSNEFTIRMASGKNASYRFDGMKLTPGAWYHIAYTFEFDESGAVKPALFVNGEQQTVTSWSLGDTEKEGEVTFAGPVWEWKAENVVAIGGYLHKTGSVRGNADNLMVWEKALNEQNIATAMNDISTETLPTGLIGYFDFENDADTDGLFVNLGKGSFKAGMHTYKDTEVEGQGTLMWRQPEYCTGCPFVKGKAFDLKPTVSWTAPGARIIESTDNTDNGSIRLSYPDTNSDTDLYPVRITIANEYGEDYRDIFLRFRQNSVEAVQQTTEALSVTPTFFESEIGISAPEDGHVIVSLFTSDGRRVLANDFMAVTGEILKIYPDVPSGLYLLNVEKEGRNLGTVKVIRR
ncbi:MAG: hypothetical protein K2K26_00580 [Muribaculaceae bacterium]|nr:hypothetical protein [Muribaculaceae bacterium]